MLREFQFTATTGASVSTANNADGTQTITVGATGSGGTLTGVTAGTGISVTGSAPSPTVSLATYPTGLGFWYSTGGVLQPAAIIPGGDLSAFTVTGTTWDFEVAGILHKTLPALPGTDQYLHYTGSAWAFSALPTSLPPNGAAGGDLGGTYPNPTVVALTGSGGIVAFRSGTSTLTFDQATGSPIIEQNTKTSDAAPATLTIQAQGALATASTNTTGGELLLSGGTGATSSGGTGGDVVLNTPANPATGAIHLQQGGTDVLTLRAGNAVGSATVNIDLAKGAGTSGIRVGPPTQTADAVAPGVTLAAGSPFASAATHTSGGALDLAAGGSQSGNPGAQVLLTGATNSAAGVVSLIGALGSSSGFSFAWQSVALTTTGGTLTLSGSQYNFPMLVCSGTLGSNQTIVFPDQPGFWIVNAQGITFGGNSLLVKAGSTTIAAATSPGLFFVFTFGGGSILIK